MKSNYFTWTLFGVIIFGFAIWTLMLILTWNQDKPNGLLIDMGKTGASLALVTVIGGIVQLILKERDAAKQKEAERLTFYRNVLSDFKNVYDKIEKARLLIQAHRTAKTYGEQMRELIDGVVILHNIKRALNPEFPDLLDYLEPRINKMSAFIKNLLAEYQENYKRISVLQSIDEEKLALLKLGIANKTIPEVRDEEIPGSAWKEMEKLSKLSAIREENFSKYRSDFLVHLDEASTFIRSQIPIKKNEKNNYISKTVDNQAESEKRTEAHQTPSGLNASPVE